MQRVTGVSPEEQRERLRHQQRRHTIITGDAYLFGLLDESHHGNDSYIRWSHFVYQQESGWNLAASMVLLRSNQNPDSEKTDNWTTLRCFKLAGVPSTPKPFRP